LDIRVFEGISGGVRRTNGLPSLDEIHGSNRTIKSRNPNSIASRHAEEGILNSISKSINEHGLTHGQLKGRTVNVHISNSGGVCDTCFSQLGNSTGKNPGVLKQFSQEYPELTLRVPAEGGNARRGANARKH
jgi:hypothetical protein